MRSVSDRITPRTEALLVALGLAVLYLLLRSSPFVAPGAFSDDGVYLALGKALADGEGYRSMYAVGEPVHQRYPPGLPGVHALLWWVGGELSRVYPAALLLSLAVTSAAAGLLWWVARQRLALSVPVALCFAVGPFLLEGSVQYFNLAVSEPWFIAIWAAALVLFPRAAGTPPPEQREEATPATGPPAAGKHAEPDLRAGISLGFLVALAMLFRTQGIVLVPAILLGFVVLRRGWKVPLAFSAATLLPFLVWRVWYGRILARGPVGTQPDEGGYESWMPTDGLAGAPRRVVDLISYQMASYGVYMPDHITGLRPLGIVLWVAFAGLMVAGALRLWRRQPDLVLSCGAALATVLLWPWSQDRFLLTILPFLGLLAGSEVEGWWRRGGMRRGRTVMAGLALLTLLVGARQLEIRNVSEAELAEMEIQFHPAHYLQSSTRYVVAASVWVLENTRPDETLLAPQPVGIWLHTGRQVVNATPALPHVGPSIWDEPGHFLAERLAADRPDLVVLGSLLYEVTRDMAAVQQACPRALEHLGASERFGRVVFFRVRYHDPCLEDVFLEPARRRLGS